MNDMRKLMETATALYAVPETKIDTWFERDRAYVGLNNAETDETIIEWWDEDVAQAVEDGFLDPSDWHGSALDYAKHLGIL